MPLNFTPRTEEELKKTLLLPEGEYDFEVTGAEDTVSKQGNAMIKLTLKVFAPDGNTTPVYDYLLEALEYKVKHFCDSVGLINEYQAGTLDADMCSNRMGRCFLKIDKDKTGKYDDKNMVKDYIGQAINAADIASTDDCPF